MATERWPCCAEHAKASMGRTANDAIARDYRALRVTLGALAMIAAAAAGAGAAPDRADPPRYVRLIASTMTVLARTARSVLYSP